MQNVVHVSPTHVRARREALGLSYNDLSLRLNHRGITLRPQVISQWERGQRELNLTSSQINLLADALRCTPDELSQESNDSNGKPVS